MADNTTLNITNRAGVYAGRLDGDIQVNGIGNLLEGIEFDAVLGSKPDSVTEVYTYKTGGAGGTTVATVTITYEDSTKEFILSAVRT